MENLITYAKSILFFLLFSNIVMQLLKGSCYERFVHPVCGMLLVILILQPMLKWFGAEEKLLFAAEQKISLLLAENKSEFFMPSEAGYEFSVLEEYEAQLMIQLEELLKEEKISVVSADFSLSAEEKDFGTIRGIRLEAEAEEKEETGMIQIPPIFFGGTKEEDTLSAREIYIKDKLSDFYRLDKENIYVNIREEQNG